MTNAWAIAKVASAVQRVREYCLTLMSNPRLRKKTFVSAAADISAPTTESRGTKSNAPPSTSVAPAKTV